MPFVDAYRKDTGEKVRIPAHWIGHPRLGDPFAKTPRQKARDRAADQEATTHETPVAGDKKE